MTKKEQEGKQAMLKVLKELAKRVQKGEITDLVALGYGNKKVVGGTITDPIVGYGLVKDLERDIDNKYKAANCHNSLGELLKLISDGDEE